MELLKLLGVLYLILGITRCSISDDSEFHSREPLSEKEFKQELQRGLHVVEFYSPYCPHCIDFAPIWHETWRKFHEEGEKLNISFVQVNCVKDGDLCFDEGIGTFPAIRLYGPHGFIKNYPDEFERTEKDLIAFARQEALDPINMETMDVDISSKFLNAQDFNEILAGRAKQPYLVSFWPSSDREDPLAEGKVYGFCSECQSFQKLWSQITRKLLIHGVDTGHINCETLPNLCNEMGFQNLVSDGDEEGNSPGVALVLPGKGVNNLFVYENGFSSSIGPYEDFVARVLFNTEAPEISSEQIVELIQQKFQIPESKNQPFPSQAVHIVFSYSEENAVPEDFHVLEHLVRHLTKLPNAYLHKSKDDVPHAAKQTLLHMYEKVNYNASEPLKQPKTEYLNLNLVPQSPTFYIFKEGDWVPHLYLGDSTTETRNVEALTGWFNQSALPVISKITSHNFEQFLTFQQNDYKGVAIQLINSSDTETIRKSNELLENFITAAYDFEDVRMQNVVDLRAAKRAEKAKKVKELKAAKASSSKLSKVYQDKIDLEDKNKIILGYVDVSKGSQTLKDLGFHKGRNDYRSGDVLLVDARSGSFIEKDVFGNRLMTNSKYLLRETLVKLALPDLSHFRNDLESHELSFNYNRQLGIFEPMKQYRVWRYFFLVGAVVLVFRVPALYKKFKVNKNYYAKRNTAGLLGEPHKRSRD